MQTKDIVVRSAQLPGLDLLKFSMAICVVAIHSRLFRDVPWLHPLVHPLFLTAVPVFFIVSSYLFFSKVARNGNADGWDVLGHYLKRMGLFYLFWFVVMLPVTIVAKQWYLHFGAGVFFRSLFLGSTFRGSWFIMALLLGIPIVFMARKALGAPVVFFLALAVYMASLPALEGAFPVLDWIGRKTFTSSLLWIALGAWLADMPSPSSLPPTSHKRFFFVSQTILRWMALLVVYALMIAAEHVEARSAVALLKPILKLAFVSLLFALALECRIGNAALCLRLRQLSILIYVIHFVFAYATAFARQKYPVFGNGFLRFSVVFGSALVVSSLFLWLKDKPRFSWLKWGV